MIGIIVCISCSPLHGITCNTPYERSIFSLFSNIKHDDYLSFSKNINFNINYSTFIF